MSTAVNPNETELKLINAIVEECDICPTDNEKYCTHEIELDDDIVVTVRGRYSTNGYCEDDYHNGTGGWILTDAEVTIDEIEAYDADGNDVDLDVNDWIICKMVEQELEL